MVVYAVFRFFLILPYVKRNREFEYKKLPDYYIKKIIRIYPAYLCALFLGLILRCYIIDDVSTMLLFRGAWGHFWYMPVIILFYLIAPIFVAVHSIVCRLAAPKYRIAYMSVLCLIAVCFGILFPYTQYNENSIRLVWYLPVFILGMIIACLFDENKNGKKIYDIVAFVGMILIIIQTPLFRQILWKCEPGSYLQNKYMYISVCWCIVLIGISKGKLIKNLLEKSRVLKAVGDYSYEVYLLHFVILNRLCRIFPNNTFARAVGTVVITGVCSFAVKWIFDYISKKLNRFVIIAGLVTIVVSCVLASDKDISQRLYVPTMINKCNQDYFIVDYSMIASFYGFKEKGLMKDEYHYTQEGYNLIGKEAGDMTARYIN